TGLCGCRRPPCRARFRRLRRWHARPSERPSGYVREGYRASARSGRQRRHTHGGNSARPQRQTTRAATPPTQPSSAAAVEWLIAERNALRIISRFNDDDDEYFPHSDRPPGVSKGLLSSALPVGFGLNLSQLPAACAVSPCRHYVLSRPQVSNRAHDRFTQSTWLLACSFHGNFGWTTTAAVPDLHRLQTSKIAYENRSSYGDGRASRRDRTTHVQTTTMNTRLQAHCERNGIWRAIGWALFILLATVGGAAAQAAVDLQLVLAVDASGSVDQVRFELQKRGYVAAFRHARVLQA